MSGEKHKFSSYHIAVLIPCINEETTIGKVVKDFKQLLPAAKMYVYDNNSTDRTKERAIQAGAIVRSETLKGKGNVIRRMFADIEADVYVLVNGDDTYHAASVIDMIELLVRNQLDMVNGARSFEKSEVFRSGHRLGNRILSNLVRIIFGKDIKDMLSGFRVFSHRFVKSFPAMSRGFEIETELTIHALELRLKVAEIETPFKMRPPGSFSKLNTIRDGLNILRIIIMFIKEERPFRTFFTVSIILALTSIILAIPIFMEYLETGLVPRFPTAILCSALMLLSFFSQYTGFILDTTTTAKREIKRLCYLQLPAIDIDPNLSDEIIED
jgi:glycosyltransferase involved in cell wall biosynthesis